MSQPKEISFVDSVRFVNEIGLVFSDNDCQLKFSVQGEPRITQSHVAMTPRTAKLLYKILEKIIVAYEADSGIEIPFDQSKLDDAVIGDAANGSSA